MLHKQSLHPCIYVSMYLCIYVSMYRCIYTSMYVQSLVGRTYRPAKHPTCGRKLSLLVIILTTFNTPLLLHHLSTFLLLSSMRSISTAPRQALFGIRSDDNTLLTCIKPCSGEWEVPVEPEGHTKAGQTVVGPSYTDLTGKLRQMIQVDGDEHHLWVLLDTGQVGHVEDCIVARVQTNKTLHIHLELHWQRH
jgi:hypothetical protein